jgi:hypothetical protein
MDDEREALADIYQLKFHLIGSEALGSACMHVPTMYCM